MEVRVLAVTFGALRTRRAPAVVLAGIAALVCAAAVAAPLYVFAAQDALVRRDIAAAPAPQRLISVGKDLSLTAGTTGVNQYLAEIRENLTLPGFDEVPGVRVGGSVTAAGRVRDVPLAYRDGVCTHLDLSGACPSGAGQVLLSTRTAEVLGVRIGDPVRFESSAIPTPVPLHVVGLYQRRDPGAAYWGGDGTAVPDAVFADRDTVLSSRAAVATATLDLIATPTGLTSANVSAVGQLVNQGAGDLRAAGYQVSSRVPDLVEHIRADQRLVLLGVPAGAGQLVLFGWYALFLAVTASAAARRPDLGLAKLRGLPTRQVWALAGQQAAVPVLVGALPGIPVGVVLARVLAGPIPDPGQFRLAGLLALGAAALAVLGGLAAALLAERGSVRSGVLALLRRTPPRRARRGYSARTWRSDVVDVVLVALALAGLVQVRWATHGPATGLAVVAPALVALAAGLVVARLLVPVASRCAVARWRAGRPRSALTATYLARRPGLDRMLALVAIAVAIGGYAVLARDTALAARRDRAAVALGADRVLDIAPVGVGRLRSAVAAADPTGRYALAAVELPSHTGVAAVLAVDTSRLAAVANWQSGYGLAPGQLATLLRPPATGPVWLRASRLRIVVDVVATGPAPPYLAVALSGLDGSRRFARYGPLPAGTGRFTADVPGCDSGCRLDAVVLAKGFGTTGLPMDPPEPGTEVVLRELAGVDSAGLPSTGVPSTGVPSSAAPSAGLPSAVLADRARWRTTNEAGKVGPVLTGDVSGLRITIPPADQFVDGVRPDGGAYLVNAPVPLPMALVGALTDPGPIGVTRIDLAGTLTPVRVAATMAVLPRLGRAGALVDLDYADRVAGPFGPLAGQVWLAADAPPDLPDRLRTAGLTVTGTDSMGAAIDRYGEQAPALALRYQELAAGLGLLLAAAGVLLVAAVERRPRARELAALRVQGAGAGVLRSVAIGGYAWLAGAAVLAGLLIAVLGRRLVPAALPVFGDGWSVLPDPSAPRWGALGVVGLALLVGFGGLAIWSGYRLVRAVAGAGGTR